MRGSRYEMADAEISSLLAAGSWQVAVAVTYTRRWLIGYVHAPQVQMQMRSMEMEMEMEMGRHSYRGWRLRWSGQGDVHLCHRTILAREDRMCQTAKYE